MANDDRETGVQTPTVNFTDYLSVRDRLADHELPEAVLAQCREAWTAMCEVGLIASRDPRIRQPVVDRQQALLARYFARPAWAKRQDEPTDGNHQVGVTPPYLEFSLPYAEWRASLVGEENQPASVVSKDPKWRWMEPIGPRPPLAEQHPFEHLNRDPVVPQGFDPDEWRGTMVEAGEMLMDTTMVLLEMLALGAELSRDAFTEICTLGTHLLAPTGINLSEYTQPGLCMAAAHDDLGFATSHFQANLPGCLRGWDRAGRRFQVRVPQGHILTQAAQEFESVTGGAIYAGMHEVVVPQGVEIERVITELRRQADAEHRDLWRTTTTGFFHARSQARVGPRWHFRTPVAMAKYPDMLGGEHLDRGIRLIGISQPHA